MGVYTDLVQPVLDENEVHAYSELILSQHSELMCSYTSHAMNKFRMLISESSSNVT